MKKKSRFIMKQAKDIIIILLLVIIGIFTYQYNKPDSQEINKKQLVQYRIDNSKLLYQILEQIELNINIETERYIIKTAQQVLDCSDYPFKEELIGSLRNVQAVLELQNHKKDSDVDKSTEYIRLIKSDIIHITKYIYLTDDFSVDTKTEEDIKAYYDKNSEKIIDLTKHINNFCEIILSDLGKE